jgi:N-glycosylase/DNA lyase
MVSTRFQQESRSLRRLMETLDNESVHGGGPATPSSSRKRSPPSTPIVLDRHQVAKVAVSSPYKDLGVSPGEFRPSATLTTGQCFHWRVVGSENDAMSTPSSSAWGTHDATEWVGVLRIPGGDSIVVALQETDHTTMYRILYGPDDIDYGQVLYDYFQLDCPLSRLYETWSRQDPKRLKRIAECIPGVRIVDQDPWECLISFICSSNNNIPRITKMLTALRQQYGKPLITIGCGDQSTILYSFPSLVELKTKATEEELRSVCGMGYRAKYILATMDALDALGGESYLQKLRKCKDPDEVQELLLAFAGVGRKVADCVALFSLRQADAIPVDTHVWNICRRDYDDGCAWKDTKSVTPHIYRQVGAMFRKRFHPNSGWAHSLLFVAELPSFRSILPEDIIVEMDQVGANCRFSESGNAYLS